MRNNGFNEISQWAPIILIADHVIFEFGKPMKSKLFHVSHTWFNDQTIMRKYFCHSHFNLCVENSFLQNVQFQLHFLSCFLLCFICYLSTLCFILFSPLRLENCALLLSCFLIGVSFELFATDPYVVCTKVKFALERDISLPRWHCRINDHWYTPNVTFELRENEGFHLRYYTHPSSFVS